MLRPRIIPILLLSNNLLYKTTMFKNPIYIGDPINTVKIFNEMHVDELIIIDINASKLAVEPNYKLIQKIAEVTRMPTCYAGGIKSVLQVKKIISMGIEKIGICTSAILNPKIISEISNEIGSQSTVVILDSKKNKNGIYKTYLYGGLRETIIDPTEYAIYLQEQGAGELLINSIDREGTYHGYDYDLIDKIYNYVSIPLIINGGAGSLIDFKIAIDRYKNIGIAAGSLFVFQGKGEAVLINYPNIYQKTNFLY